MKSNTISTVLNSTRELFSTNNIESAALDAQIIVEHVLEKNRAFLLSHPEAPVSGEECLEIDSLATRRASGEPIAYLTGQKEFYGLDFVVNKNVLIPRPETEYLVEKGIEFLKSQNSKTPKYKNVVLDLGTGSGCIAISLGLELDKLNKLNNCEIFATDINENALEVAKQNAALILFDSAKQVENANGKFSTSSNNTTFSFLESDLFSNLLLPDKFDLILANLPYVPNNSEEQEKLKSEPQSAIFAEDNGSSIIKKFLEQARSRLNDNGLIIIELDPRNAIEIKTFAENLYPNRKIKLTKDYAGHDRYLEIK